MTRNWSCIRLSPSETTSLSTLLPRLRKQLLEVDNLARWSFDRVHDSTGHHLLLRIRTTTGVRDELRGILVRDDVPHTIEPYRPSPILSERVVQASSDLALDLADHADLLPFAVMHLRELIGLVKPSDRGQVLFLCWQRWSTRLLPRNRVELVGNADARAFEIEPPVLSGTAAQSWSRYLRALRAACERSDRPNYLVYEHLNDTHTRLGLEPTAQAMAARMTHAWLSADIDSRPKSA